MAYPAQRSWPGLLASGLAVMAAHAAGAVESGFGVYTIGAKGPQAGIVPPPGFYLVSQQFIYSGTYSGPVALGPGAPIPATVDVALNFNDISPVWIAPGTILGGNLGVGATLPIGSVGVDVTAANISLSDSRVAVGDPLFGIFLGWHAGPWHWNTGLTAVAPIGDYDPQRLANLSLNRPALDIYGALTWLDAASGLEISLATGLTLNGTNDHTDYRSGTELHTEWALMKYLTPNVSFGLIGYHYEQLSGDSGPGARTGAFKGLATAIGVAATYSMTIEGTSVALRLHALEEFATRNRFEDTPVFLSVVVGNDY